MAFDAEHPVPANERVRACLARRLASLLDLEEQGPKRLDLDRLCELACTLFDVPIAIVALMLDDHQHVIGAHNHPRGAIPRGLTMCAHTIALGSTLHVGNVSEDPRFKENALIRSVGVEFYLGAPLPAGSDVHVATLCLVDVHDRQLSDRELKTFSLLGELASVQLRAALERAAEMLVPPSPSKEIQQEHRAASLYDPLTGLAGPALLDAQLSEMLRQEDRSERGALVVLDLDNFEALNESRSYAFGDRVLQSLADNLRDAVGSEAVICRRGGNEFALLFANTDSMESLRRSIQTVLRIVATTSIEATRTAALQACMGVVMLGNEREPVVILRRAEIALRTAKRAGAGRVEYYSAELGARIEARIELLDDVRRGASAGEFILHYQPICNHLGAGLGFEALMRWQHPQRGLLAPYHFLVAFDDPDLATVLGDVALRDSLRQMRAWSDAALDYGYVSVNLATAQFAEGNLAPRVQLLLAEFGVAPERLMLEVTERVYLDKGADVVAEALVQLRALGVSFALDDFGTGYASLTHLKQFPIDRLKIDRSFVQGVCESKGDGAIVRAIVSLGLNLGIQLVAEGVETAPQLEFLRGLGCEQMQGYYFAKPLPATQAAAFCRPASPVAVGE